MFVCMCVFGKDCENYDYIILFCDHTYCEKIYFWMIQSTAIRRPAKNRIQHIEWRKLILTITTNQEIFWYWRKSLNVEMFFAVLGEISNDLNLNTTTLMITLASCRFLNRFSEIDYMFSVTKIGCFFMKEHLDF